MAYLDDILSAMEQGNIEGALGLIALHEAEHGEEADFYSVKAMLCIQAGEMQAAANILLEARKRYPRDGDILYNLGYLSEQLGDINPAYWFYFEAMQNLADESLKSDAEARCRALEKAPVFASHPEAVTDVLYKTSLRSIDFTRDPSIEPDIFYLMLRIEFNAGKKHAISAIKAAKTRGQVSDDQLRDYVMSEPYHQQELLKILERDL